MSDPSLISQMLSSTESLPVQHIVIGKDSNKPYNNSNNSHNRNDSNELIIIESAPVADLVTIERGDPSCLAEQNIRIQPHSSHHDNQREKKEKKAKTSKEKKKSKKQSVEVNFKVGTSL